MQNTQNTVITLDLLKKPPYHGIMSEYARMRNVSPYCVRRWVLLQNRQAIRDISAMMVDRANKPILDEINKNLKKLAKYDKRIKDALATQAA